MECTQISVHLILSRALILNKGIAGFEFPVVGRYIDILALDRTNN